MKILEQVMKISVLALTRFSIFYMIVKIGEADTGGGEGGMVEAEWNEAYIYIIIN